MSSRARNSIHALVNRLIRYEASLATFVTATAVATAALEDRMAMMAAAGDLAGAVRCFMGGVNAEVGAFDRLAIREYRERPASRPQRGGWRIRCGNLVLT